MRIESLYRVIITACISFALSLPLQAEIEEVVVTARKTQESLTDTPVAVSVLDGEFFDATGINTITELVRFVPGFDLTPTNTSRASGPKMRGISTFSFSDGFESSVATVIDGVVMGREAQGFFDLYGIESVEVLKGPQGTLFGKNASAGVINVRTLAPEFEYSSAIDFTYGSFDEMLIRGTTTGALIEDKVAYRLSGSFNQHDGKLDNAIPGEDDINDKDTWSLRGKLLFTPSDVFEATVIADYVTEENRCCLPTYRVVGPPAFALGFALNSPVLQLADALNSLGIDAGEDNREVAVFDTGINQESEAYGLSVQLDYDAAWGTLTSITAYRDWEIDEFNEADGLSISDINNRNGTISDSTQFTQEFRLAGQINDNIDFVTGLFYFNQELDAFGRVFVEIPLPIPPFFNSLNAADRTVDTESTALFGEFTYNINERLSFIFGARYTREEIDATYSRIASPILPGPFGSVFGPDLIGSQSVDDNDVSGRVIARYFWTEDAMTYATWSRGYKGPGIDVAETANAAFVAEPGGLPVLDPEIPTLWEVGAKFRLLDNTLVLNTAAFHQTVEDLQAIATDDTGIGRNLSIDEVLSTGFEADLVWVPGSIDGLTLTASLGYLDTTIEQFDERPDLEDQRFRDVARWTFSTSIDYRWPIGNGGYNGFVRGEWYTQSDKNTDLDDDPANDVDGYDLVNLRLGISSPEDRYRITLMAENLLDEDYPFFVGGSSYTVLDGATRAQFLGDPATYALQFAINF